MTSNELKRFEEFLKDSFGEGVYSRELRLSDEEVKYVKDKYPRATFKKCSVVDNSDEKTWWEVNLLGNQKRLRS